MIRKRNTFTNVGQSKGLKNDEEIEVFFKEFKKEKATLLSKYTRKSSKLVDQ